MLAAFGVMPARETKVHQRVQIGVGKRKDMPSPASVTAIGAPEFLVFFVPERDASGPAISGGDVNKGFVDKLHGGWTAGTRAIVSSATACPALFTHRKSAGPASTGFINEKPRAMRRVRTGDLRRQAAVMLTVCLFSAPFIAKDTLPSASANKV